jgi:L-amino acid N-acyltransferase YncA
VVGYLYAGPWRDRPAYRYPVEDTAYLASSATGRGLGSKLLTALIQDGAGTGMHRLLTVCADTGHPASQALHRACGFAQGGRLHKVGYKHGGWIDTVLWQRELIPGGL